MTRSRSLSLRRTVPVGVTVLATAAALALPGAAAHAATDGHKTSPTPQSTATSPVVRHVAMGDGSTISVTADGTATQRSHDGKVLATQQLPPTVATPLGKSGSLSDNALRALFASHNAAADPGSVIAVLGSAVTGRNSQLKVAAPKLTAALRAARAGTAKPLFAGAAKQAVASSPLADAVVLTVPKGTSASAAAALRKAGATFAEPNRYVSSMSTGDIPLTTSGKVANPQGITSGLPSNFGMTSSLQSFLNAGGVDAMGAYRELTKRYGELPGTGERITNVSVGDLTDASMNDQEVQTYGPTTVIQGGQRYLDLPSMPLIPTYTSDANGALDPTGSTEGEDPTLGEVLLDFGVMAPLPHDKQRAGSIGTGVTDLLGIAPGAKYRLVVPQTPTTGEIAGALLAAARQTPRPNVITASLGFGTDSEGFPGRYFEDDPVIESVVQTIVHQYGIVVTISSNDGTRLYTPTSIGPDGGSTPTDLTRSAKDTTSIADDELSTTPSKVLDSGAIAVGGTTLDDTLTVSQRSTSSAAGQATYATTRTNGSGAFSSGFGSRINVSAPSDGIVVYSHKIRGGAQDVQPGISGGTSAAAPEVAAAAAVLLQSAKLAGKTLTPAQVRSILERTGRPVATPQQADRKLQVGNQVDVTAAVDSVLPASKPALTRVSVAHRVTHGQVGASFTEDTDQDYIDLSGNDPASGTATSASTSSGLGLTGPVTIAGDLTGLRSRKGVTYRLSIGKHHYTSTVPSIRLLPTVMLQDARKQVVSQQDRTISYSFSVLKGSKVLATQTKKLTFGPTDGTFVEAPEPVMQPTVEAGRPVKVTYDLRGVRATSLHNPSLVVSHVGHWNPVLGPIFSPAYRVPLTDTHGVVTIPASAFGGGGGIYGIGYAQTSTDGSSTGSDIYGEFASIRVVGGTAAQRPAAPTLGTGGAPSAHEFTVTDAAPTFSVGYDVSSVPGAASAVVEVSAPAPTLYKSLNTFVNQNGTQRDNDGVDAGSVAYQSVSGKRGSVELSAKTLGLVGSDTYDIRVLAIGHHGDVVGQASPSSALQYDDGVDPAGSYVAGFGVTGDGTSVVDTIDASGASALRDYSTATGTYGAVLATDPNPDDSYTVVGVDPASDRAVVIHHTGGGDQVQTYAPETHALIGSHDLSGDYVSGQVDTKRHRAALLVHDSSGADTVQSVDDNTGALGQPIAADTDGVPTGKFQLLAVDQSNGDVLLSTLNGGSICFVGAGYLATVDLDTSSVKQSAGDGCTDGLDDDDNGTAELLTYRSFSVNIQGSSSLLPIDETTAKAGSGVVVRQQYPLGLAVDGTHQVALVAYVSPVGQTHFGGNRVLDNNATSELAEVDLKTGKVLRSIGGFNFTYGQLSPWSGTRGLQLDPATRTGWTYAPDGVQVQSFHY